MIARETSLKVEKKKVSSPPQAAEILYKYLDDTDRENMVAMLLDTKNNVIGINTVSVGSLNASIVHPREVLKPAILANAASFILCHNHPSGDPSPSSQDLEVTRRLHDACNIIGIQLRDHVILGDNSFFSFREKGLLTSS